MDFTLLGPVAAELDGRPVALDGAKQRTVLAALLLANGRVVTDERLTTLLWGEEPPATSTSQLYTYVSRLRTRLGPGHGLERHGAGYRLDTGARTVDWHTFQQLADAGRADLRAGRHADAERRLADALALWHGPALSDVTDHLATAEGPGMTETHLATVEHHTEAALALGEHTTLVPVLTRAVTRHPLRERLRAQLMTALDRCGRRPDALTAYEAGRRLLAEELGIDPGPELRTLHQQILAGTLPGPTPPRRDTALPAPAPPRDPAATPMPPVPPVPLAVPALSTTAAVAMAAAVAAPTAVPALPVQAATAVAPAPTAVPATDALPPTAAAPATPPYPTPHGCPAAPGDFTGRGTELREVLAALGAGQDVVVTGAPGTGKSALALHAAERVRRDFPGGRLYADLRTADGTPCPPRQVLGWFLRALGVDEHRIPDGVEERTALYRTLLAGRRVLVVLDNAADDTQVRPLLPGGGDSRTVVTGIRPGLAGLAGTRLVRLGPMTPAEATRLLARIVGPERLAADAASVARVAEYCDRLPLALRIAAARLADRPHWPVSRLAARLAAEDGRLAELRIGSLDLAATLRPTLEGLDGPTAAALDALTAAGLRVLTPADAAAVLDLPHHEAEDVLDRLADARLLEPGRHTEGAVPRYHLAPLVRLFARTRVLVH
ncbi:BTAD domain-containing putative transcriptional regulator [Streptomyces sp. NPDC001568]|uniref:AfsR/SARP family transcriptional regulator n=1 Tax=Streptomyces sp. NPDC001568 TaxID=3364588 RepID=UPI003685F7C6